MTRVEWRGTRMEYATRGRFGGLGLKTIGGRVYGFGPQNLGGGSKKERTTRGGIEEFSSRRSYLMKGYLRLDHSALGLNGSTKKYLRAKLGLCNSPVKSDDGAPIFLTSFILLHPSLGFPLPLGFLVREVHKLENLCKNQRLQREWRP